MTETLEPKKQDYSQIHQENKGSFQVGRIRMHEGQLAFKNASTHDVDQYSIETDIEKATWFRASKGYTLRLFLKNGDIKTYLGFSKTDFNNIRAHFPELNHISHSSRGWNFGEIDIDGSLLTFNDPKKEPMFEVCLTNVSNCLASKNELALEFHHNDEAPINLLEMRFHIPSESLAKEYQADILDHADVLEARGKAIATFENIQCLIPRGRFEIKLYEKLMHVRGKSHDYKIPYKTILRSFCLPQTDGVNYYFIVALDPPLKQGNTWYHFLTIQFHKDDELDLELQVEDEDELKSKYGGKISKEMNGPLYQLFSACLKAIAKARIHSSGDTWGAMSSRWACIPCSHKANQGLLYPLEKAFIYGIKPRPIYLRFEEIDCVKFAHGGKKSFEFEITLKSGDQKKYEFNSMEREEYPRLFKFCQEKSIKIKNLGKNQNVKTVPLLEGDDSAAHRMLAEGELDDDTDESDDADFDLDQEYEKEKKQFDKDDAFEEDSGSGGSSEFEGSDDDDYDGQDIIDMDEEDEQVSRSKSSSKSKSSRNRTDGSSTKKSKKSKDPNAPKKPLTAFFQWLQINRPKLKEENPDADLGALGKLAGEKWRELTDDEKKPFEDKYKEMKVEYDEKMANYVPGGEFAKVSMIASKSGSKARKDPNAPKKPMTAYFQWFSDNRARIKVLSATNIIVINNELSEIEHIRTFSP